MEEKLQLRFQWADGTHPDFVRFSACLESYFNRLVGGKENRGGFIPYNSLREIHDVLLVYVQGQAAACGSFKRKSEDTAEIKRLYVSEPFRGKGISRQIMQKLEQAAARQGFLRLVLQTREACTAAVHLYESMGYCRISNYPPYDRLPLAVCFEKRLAGRRENAGAKVQP